MKKTKRVVSLFAGAMLLFSMVIPLNVNAAKRVKLNKTKVSLAVGNISRLKVVNSKKKVVWKSSKKSVAKVNKSGVVRGLKPGKTVITAKVGKKSLKCKVTVKESPSLNVNDVRLCVNDTTLLCVKGTSKSIKWSTKDSSVATVKSYDEKSAIVTGLKYGVTKVVAKVGKKKILCHVSVEKTVQMDIEDLEIANSAIRSFSFLSNEITVSSSNPAVAIAKPKGEILGIETYCRVADVIVYGISDGSADITIKNNLNDEKVTFKAVVKKPKTDDAKQKLIDYLYINGLDKEKTEYCMPFEYIDGNVKFEYKVQVDDGSNTTMVEYNPYIDDFIYTFSLDYATSYSSKVWKMIPNPVEKDKYIVRFDQYSEAVPPLNPPVIETMSIDADTDRKVFDGEVLQFSEFGHVVNEDVNKLANEFHKGALEKVDSLLKNVIGIAISEL